MAKLRRDLRWIIAVTQPQREKWAGENIKRQNHDFYLPMCRELVRPGVIATRPLFPRYIFVRVTVQWRFLTGTFGIMGIVLDGETPSVVPDNVIGNIKSSEGNNDHLIDLVPANIGSDGVPLAGTMVQVTGGPFTGLVGPLMGKSGEERVRVLLSVFGRQVETKVDLREIRVA